MTSTLNRWFTLSSVGDDNFSSAACEIKGNNTKHTLNNAKQNTKKHEKNFRNGLFSFVYIILLRKSFLVLKFTKYPNS